MQKLTIYELQDDFYHYLDRVEKGETFMIVDDHGKEYVLRPLNVIEQAKFNETVEDRNADGSYNVELDIKDSDFITLAKNAHKRDITINNYIASILDNYIKNNSNIFDGCSEREIEFINCVSDMVHDGITEDTITELCKSFHEMTNTTYINPLDTLIKRGFELADKRME
jgi:hypothetical protein